MPTFWLLPMPLALEVQGPLGAVDQTMAEPVEVSTWPLLPRVLRPVPPLAAATTPVTLAALPLMLPLMSAPGRLLLAVMAEAPLPFT